MPHDDDDSVGDGVGEGDGYVDGDGDGNGDGDGGGDGDGFEQFRRHKGHRVPQAGRGCVVL